MKEASIKNYLEEQEKLLQAYVPKSIMEQVEKKMEKDKIPSFKKLVNALLRMYLDSK